MGRLTVSQLAAVKGALDTFEQRVRSGMHNPLVDARVENFSAFAGEVHDTGDEAVADELMSIDGALGERASRELEEIERARQRIAGDGIGECVECAGDIALERLLVNPVAERCIECESRRERSYAHAATPRL